MAIRQKNFSAGELSPLAWGNTDSSAFAKGSRKLENYFVSKEGAAVSRPGTTFVRATKSPAGEVRLIPFVVSDTESYVVELNAGYTRFHQNGATVLSGGSPLEVGNTYTAGELPALHWAQSGDQLYITSPSRPPQILSRTAVGPPPTFVFTPVSMLPPKSPGGTPWWVKVPSPGTALHAPVLYDGGGLFVGDATHPVREWRYKVSALIRSKATGRTFETLAYEVSESATISGGIATLTALAAGVQIVRYPDKPVTLTMNLGTYGTETHESEFELLTYLYYAGRGELFGFIGDSKNETFVDLGEAPNFDVQPLTGRDPFQQIVPGPEYPSSVAFFQERLAFGGSNLRPSWCWLSSTDGFNDFSVHVALPPLATDALEIELSSRQREAVRDIAASGRRLLIGTGATVRSLSGSSGPVSPSDLNVQVEDEVGIEANTSFLIVAGVPLYVRAKGRGVRALSLNRSGTSFDGVDLSRHANHLFVGGEALPGQPTRRVKEWAYAEDPWGLVWAVREDGVLLSLTMSGNDAGWARHTTDGYFRHICVVPEGSEDGVYVVVERTGGFYVERLNTRVENGNPLDWGYVDSAVAVTFGAVAGYVVTGLSHLEGKDVWFTAQDNAPRGPLRVTGGQVTLPGGTPEVNYPGGQVYGFVGLLFMPTLESLDAISADTRTKQKLLVSVGLELQGSRGLHVGPDAEHVTELRQRDVTDSYGAVATATKVVKMNVSGAWANHGRVYVQQRLPLPSTLLAIIRDLDTGG